MKKFVEGALVANAASMGFNWIYNLPYLEKLSKEQELVFQRVNKEQYDRAGKSYLAYPFAEVGDVSAQGEILKWLYHALSKDKELNRAEYEDLVYEHIKPGGTYRGWIESYGRKLIINKLLPSVGSPFAPLEQNDDQLIGFIPYLVCKELNKPVDYAWYLAQVFTNNSAYPQFFRALDQLLIKLKSKSMRQAIEEIIPLTPHAFQDSIIKAIEISDTKEFIMKHSGTACHIPHAVPLIFHILYHTSSFEEAVKLNTLIGGASCDRGSLIGAIYAQVSEIPKTWLDKIKL